MNFRQISPSIPFFKRHIQPISPNFIAELTVCDVARLYTIRKSSYKRSVIKKILLKDPSFRVVIEKFESKSLLIDDFNELKYFSKKISKNHDLFTNDFKKKLMETVEESCHVTESSYLKHLIKKNAVDVDQDNRIIQNSFTRLVPAIRGSKLEQSTLHELEKKKAFKIIDRNTAFMKYNNFVIIKGRIDGMVEVNGEKKVIEVKNRLGLRNNLFSKHDKIQSLLYMELVGVEKCLFIERLPNGVIIESEFLYDNGLLLQILNYLSVLVKEIRRIRVYDLSKWIN